MLGHEEVLFDSELLFFVFLSRSTVPLSPLRLVLPAVRSNVLQAGKQRMLELLQHGQVVSPFLAASTSIREWLVSKLRAGARQS